MRIAWAVLREHLMPRRAVRRGIYAVSNAQKRTVFLDRIYGIIRIFFIPNPVNFANPVKTSLR